MLFLRNGTGMQITDVEATPEGDFSGNCNASSATVNATKDFNVVCFNTGVSAGQTYAGKIRIEYKRRLAEHVETATCTGTAPLGGILLVGGPLPGNQAPDANLTASAYSANVGTYIAFYGNASSDPDGNIVNYAWDFGDGNTVASGTSIMYHAYSGAGTKNIALTVTDNNGATDANTIGVSISAGPVQFLVDVNIVRPNGGEIMGVRDGNYRIDFNVSNKDCNGVFFCKIRIDANIDYNVGGGWRRIVTDLNLMATATAGSNKGIYCDDLNFAGSKDANKQVTCHYDWNLAVWREPSVDSRIDVNVTDNNGSTDTNRNGKYFKLYNWLVSSESTATAYNNGRKLVRNSDGNRIYLVYPEDMPLDSGTTDIWFTQSD